MVAIDVRECASGACERLGARVMAAWKRWWYAEFLPAREHEGDDLRADELELEAKAEAEALGLALERHGP